MSGNRNPRRPHGHPKNGHPTDTPRPQVFVQNLTGFSHGPGDPIGSVQDNQLWGVLR
jgi:hypothetical protein